MYGSGWYWPGLGSSSPSSKEYLRDIVMEGRTKKGNWKFDPSELRILEHALAVLCRQPRP
jgi:hypothetical protein